MSVTEGSEIGTVHYLADAQHYNWDNSNDAALTINPGDTVVFKCREAADGQITPESTSESARALDFDRIHSLTGPVFVSGAEPGDALQVEILEIRHEGWAWTVVYPGLGLLHEEFGDTTELWQWKVDSDGRAEFKPGIRVPIEPFCGEMGVALAEPGAHDTLPARRVGGNLDVRHLCQGSVLFLPVEVPGALFSVGDGHLAQGDGEICGTALEAPLTVTLRFDLQKRRELSAPAYETSGPTTTKSDAFGHFVHTAVGQDMQRGAQEAVRSTMAFLEARYGLSRLEAYILCSATGDLKISVPVLADGHASVVSFHLPKSIFVS